MLRQLVYISTARRPLDQSERDSILAASLRNNGARQITGLLVAGGNRFLQLLEGPEAAVRERFDVIRQDPRHFAVVTLHDRAIDRRQCPDWSMGFIAAGEPGSSEDLGVVVDRLVEPITDANLRAQFTGFAALRRDSSAPARS